MGQARKLQRALIPGAELRYPINDPRQWHRYGPTPAFDLDAYQAKIDNVVGLTITGAPIVRIVDAQKSLRWECGHWRLRYRYFQTRIDTPEGLKFFDAAPPRYIFEERLEPAQYMPSWEAARYIRAATGEEVDVLGEPPVDGIYRPFRDAVEHRHDCCARFPNLKCWGVFRFPNEADLDRLAAVKQAAQADDTFQSPTEPISARTLAAIALESEAYSQAEDDELLNTWREFWTNEYATLAPLLLADSPKRLKHGQHHFTRTPSGLVYAANH
jgi:hypothetical protein